MQKNCKYSYSFTPDEVYNIILQHLENVGEISNFNEVGDNESGSKIKGLYKIINVSSDNKHLIKIELEEDFEEPVSV